MQEKRLVMAIAKVNATWHCGEPFIQEDCDLEFGWHLMDKVSGDIRKFENVVEFRDKIHKILIIGHPDSLNDLNLIKDTLIIFFSFFNLDKYEKNNGYKPSLN